jgi:F-type H+-transporting ATPase subunit delta
MAGARLSRRKIAAYFADELIAGRDVTKPLAAYLVESKRTREAILVIRDIEAALATRGVLLADIASARSLADDTKNTITHYLKSATGAKTVHLRSEVDESLLGGVRIETPGQRLDNTLRQRINQLTASKI